MLSRRSVLSLAAAVPLRAFAAPTGKVRITGFEIHKVSVRWRDLMFVEVHTDAGITGLGEATLESRTDIAESVLRWLEPEYVGLDPAGPEEHWNRVYYVATRWRNGPALMTGLSAIDMALWDIEAKRLGVPLHRLLGGAIRNELRVYFTHWDASIPKEKRVAAALADLAAKTREQGWTAVKYTLPQAESELERIDRDAAELAAVRKVFGSHADIALECAETFSVRTAIQFASAIAPYRPLFLEEPSWRENPAGLGEIAAKSPVPIATGEGLFSRYEFKQLLDVKGAAIIQPDVMHAGGITELRKIANMAEAYGVEVAPHQCSGPIAHMASMAAMSVCRNFVIHECEGADNELFREMTEGTYPTQKNGKVRLPDAPGIGIKVNFAEFKRRCPYKAIRSKAQVKV
ncbi:MAG TPA: mandelate racemase/muconate lactonizing enzyme family protein [Bryobacteraceae bacterium]|nr:mandelate racemase/muconate lactonizing enzyme family protein [Bryobacteraceae bacterium]